MFRAKAMLATVSLSIVVLGFHSLNLEKNSTSRAAAAPSVFVATTSSIEAINADGSGLMRVAPVDVSAGVQPVLFPDGRLFFSTANSYATISRSGKHNIVIAPTLNVGESIWSVSGSPDRSTLGWQLFAPLQVNTYHLHQGQSRVVVTGPAGGSGTTVLTDQADSTAGGRVLTIIGWRTASPFGSGGSTLLLQDLYSFNQPTSLLVPNTTRGLIEYDPSIGDIVNDYLPPTSLSEPGQRLFALSADSSFIVYGDQNGLTPSGDGPLARELLVQNMVTHASTQLDIASRYPSSRVILLAPTKKTSIPLYEYFSHNAYISPDSKHVLYTVFTISYPPGARLPRIDHQAMIVQANGKNPTQVLTVDGQGAGWINRSIAVIKEADGLHTYNQTTGQTSLLVADPSARFIGARAS